MLAKSTCILLTKHDLCVGWLSFEKQNNEEFNKTMIKSSGIFASWGNVCEDYFPTFHSENHQIAFGLQITDGDLRTALQTSLWAKWDRTVFLLYRQGLFWMSQSISIMDSHFHHYISLRIMSGYFLKQNLASIHPSVEIRVVSIWWLLWMIGNPAISDNLEELWSWRTSCKVK